MKKVFVTDLEEGMVIGEDTYTASGIMIIPSGVCVTKAIIEHLMSLGLVEVVIDENAKPADVMDAPKETPKAIEFKKNYTATKDSLNNAFASILEKRAEKSTIENLIDSSWKMIDDGANTYEMLGIIYSMHSYSDSTYMHCMNVGVIATLIGKWLGWKEEDLKILNACGMFHDIGKLMIPKQILEKPGKLTPEEYAIMKTHAQRGYEILLPSGLDERIIRCALLHHERCDGSGYPLGCKADKLDDFVKIIAIADVFEALSANRVYRDSVCPFDIIAQFENNGFGIYDTKILFVFMQNIINTYLHSRVKLNNGEMAEVVLINRQAGSKPVLITSSGKTIDLAKEKDLKISEVIG